MTAARLRPASHRRPQPLPHRPVWRLRLRVLALLPALVAAPGLAGCPAGPRADEAPAARHRTAPATMQPFHRRVVASGTVRPVHATVVGAAVSGTVVQVLADFNDHVRKGQVLARLEAEEFQARLAQAMAQQQAARASLALAGAALQRQQALLQAGFVSPAAVDLARGQVQAAQAADDLAAAQVRLARADLRHTVVVSPVEGVVLSRRVDRGQTVAAGFQTPDLFVIAQDLDVVQVVAAVRETDVPALPTAGAVALRVDAWPGRSFPGRIQGLRLSDDASQGVVTYPLVVTVPNADGALRPGMSAEVRLEVDDPRPRLSVPLAALRWRPADEATSSPAASASVSSAPAVDDAGDPASPPALPPATGGPARVWVAGAGGRPEARDLVIGAIDGLRAEVRAGPLRPGERVITGSDDGPDPSRARDAAP